MTKRQMAYLVCTAAVVASGLGAAPSADHGTVHWVKPGESIQKAVNSAHPGDTVFLAPGTYHGSVRVTVPNLTLRGSGARATVIVPGASSGDRTCAKAGSGICVIGTDRSPVKGVTVSSLTLRGFAKHGLWASGTDRLTVQAVTSEKNGQWGIAQERSVRGVFRHNIAQNNGDAGLFLSNTVGTEEGARDSKGTVVTHNRLAGNRIGITVRRLRNLTIDHNEATGNCAAVFVVGDENKPHVGAVGVRRNYIHANNKFCPKTPRLPFLQGSGIVLTGADDSLVAENTVEDNVGTSPLSGGIVLFKSFVGALSQRNEIRDNVVVRNGKADLANRDPGKGNTFHGNMCARSEPAGMC
ncbi:right-handed parallel beta-helix repeat-containing protein [Streptomyces sp. NBC_01136]|uniref:right-handed parallel beta-helix repeat-containing protein n=1 Tax=unclassified Streptomyces TaxID=2593676 RepID=UPI00324C09BF|nr:right-handed parallel beta-helix repeat-containing protein [Streptomyces sp. NBC_01136]